MTHRLKSGLWFVALALPLAAVSVADGGASGKEDVTKTVGKSNVTLSVTVAGQPVAGEAIELALLLKNQRAEGISHVHVTDFRDFGLMLRDQEGKPIPKTRFGQLQIGGPTDPVFGPTKEPLGPGAEKRVCLNLARLFDCTLAGDYSLSVKLEVTLGVGKEPTILLELSDVKFRISEPAARKP